LLLFLVLNFPQTMQPFLGLLNQERVSKRRSTAWNNLLDLVGVET